METGIRISDVMTKLVITVDVKTNIKAVALLIKKHRVGSAIVTDGGKPTGIITERDMVEKVIASDLVPSKTITKDVMSTPLLSVLPDTSVYEASELMLEKNIRRLAVIDENNNLVGIVTVVDILSVSKEIADTYDDLFTQRRQRPIAPAIDNGIAAEDYEHGICESCGSFSEDLVYFNGRLVCEGCRSYMGD